MRRERLELPKLSKEAKFLVDANIFLGLELRQKKLTIVEKFSENFRVEIE